MSKRKIEGSEFLLKKITSLRFKEVWLSELVQTDAPSSSHKKKVKLCNIILCIDDGIMRGLNYANAKGDYDQSQHRIADGRKNADQFRYGKILIDNRFAAHREDLAVEDAWKQIPLMIEIETFLRKVNTMLSDVVKDVFDSIDHVIDKEAILRLAELLCNHIEKRFSDDDLMDCQEFDHCAIAKNHFSNMASKV
ncbi:hypothetical protein RF11_14108 [Thelohanellus kitauei]|uniref:Uncharacterized protein n=1 Tax=Thelohanellus kitauei TaxID=669202 RepID=A0A0C2IXU5_THEKT|nr:hypothetical protein RF11_14108 [Thelohanellus kitauei]